MLQMIEKADFIIQIRTDFSTSLLFLSLFPVILSILFFAAKYMYLFQQDHHLSKAKIILILFATNRCIKYENDDSKPNEKI
jgi:hypothetical protein